MKNNNINNNRHGNFKSACRRLLIYQYCTRGLGMRNYRKIINKLPVLNFVISSFF